MHDPVIAALIAAVGVGATLAVNAWLAERARRLERQAVATAFRSDVRSLVHVLDQMGVVDSFIACLSAPASASPKADWVDAPRREDYFQLYGAMAPRIGLTPAPLAREIVRFYTFLRASRDAAAPLAGLMAGRASDDAIRLASGRTVLTALSEALQAAEAILGASYSLQGGNDGQARASDLRSRIEAALTPRP